MTQIWGGREREREREREMPYRVLRRNVKKSDKLEDLRVYGRILLQWMLSK